MRKKINRQLRLSECSKSRRITNLEIRGLSIIEGISVSQNDPRMKRRRNRETAEDRC